MPITVERCWNCGGTGKMSETEDCPHCEAGFITQRFGKATDD